MTKEPGTSVERARVEAADVRIAASARIDPSAVIRARRVVVGDGVVIGRDVEITGEEVLISPLAIIERGNLFNATHIEIGYKCKVERDGRFRGISGAADRFVFGDYSFFGFAQNVLVPEFVIGDYTALHNSMLVSGYKACRLGHNCWVGQGTILNSTELLTIGNNVRIGTGSQLWTHVASGELLEGCTLFGSHPLVLEDNVWLVGGAVVSPNLVLRNGSIVMVGSVVTKSTEARHCYAGVPARDVSDKLKTYEPVTLEGKFEKMSRFVDEFHEATRGAHSGRVVFAADADSLPALGPGEHVVIVRKGGVRRVRADVSVFSLETKEYTKNRTILEEAFIRFHVGHRARFVPSAS